jgi:nitroreductase
VDPATVRGVLTAALRAPSAHNAQPWRLTALGPNEYGIWYAKEDKLRADPDDRDGLMAVGGFYETLRLAAEAAGLAAPIEIRINEGPMGIEVGIVRFAPLDHEPDPLAGSIQRRQCNRFPYARTTLPPGLAGQLEGLGHVLLAPDRVAGLVSRASVLSWKDRRFVADLEQWTRFDDRATDGMTFDCLRLNRLDVVAFRVALRLGTLPGWLAWIYAQRDVRLTRASGAMAVLIAEDRRPESLFECGRRLIRSWTLINSLGYAWHPMSVVIDQSTVDELRGLIGGRDPVAIYRVGEAPGPAAWSKRRPLDAVLVPALDSMWASDVAASASDPGASGP